MANKSEVLHLSVQGQYFHAIRNGTKHEEYRLVTPYWTKRLVGRTYTSINIAWGYPEREDTSRRIVRPWRGFTIQTITHPHFGPDPVEVFAIDVRP